MPGDIEPDGFAAGGEVIAGEVIEPPAGAVDMPPPLSGVDDMPEPAGQTGTWTRLPSGTDYIRPDMPHISVFGKMITWWMDAHQF